MLNRALAVIKSRTLEFSGLNGRGKAIRLLLYIGLLASAWTFVSEFHALRTVFDEVRARSFPSWGDADSLLKPLFSFLFTIVMAAIDLSTASSVFRNHRCIDISKSSGWSHLSEVIRCDEQGRIDEFGWEAGWTDATLNKTLLNCSAPGAMKTIKYEVMPEPWYAYDRSDGRGDKTKSLLRRYVIQRTFNRGRKTFNGKKVRLANWPGFRLTGMKLQQTDYVSSMMTDGTAFQLITNMNTEAVVSDGLSAFLEHSQEGFRLKSLQSCDSSNQLGTSILAFTSDGHLALTYQSHNNHHSGGKIAPSGSGSLDWKDVQDNSGKDLIQLVKRGAIREMEEELGRPRKLQKSKSIVQEAIVYGFSRLIHRGGKPDFFCIAYLPYSIDEVMKFKRTKKETRYTDRSFRHNGEPMNFKLGFVHEMRRVCQFYRNPTKLGFEKDKVQSYQLSYQVLHALTLLDEALNDNASCSLLESFFRRHYSFD